MSEQSKFPEGVREITFDEMGKFGIEDSTGKLYWGAREVQVKKVVSLRDREFFFAALASGSAFGIFLIELYKVCWPAH